MSLTHCAPVYIFREFSTYFGIRYRITRRRGMLLDIACLTCKSDVNFKNETETLLLVFGNYMHLSEAALT